MPGAVFAAFVGETCCIAASKMALAVAVATKAMALKSLAPVVPVATGPVVVPLLCVAGAVAAAVCATAASSIASAVAVAVARVATS